MDQLATGIGWTVIVIGVVYGIGKLLEHWDNERRKPLIVWDHERRLAFRKIYRGTEDTTIHNAIKMADGGWSLCEFGLSDSEYHDKMISEPGSTEYRRALENIRSLGDAYTLRDKKLVGRHERDA